jgi:hypothetical protein
MAALWSVVADFILDQRFGFQDANKIKNNIIAVASGRLQHYLGGDRLRAVPNVASAQDAINYIDVELDGTQLAGLTVQARVEVRTANAGTTVTPKIRNVTDASDAGTGVACSATNTDYTGTNQKQTITLTVASGIKKYRLQLTPSNTTNDVFGTGYIEIFATS